MPNLAEAFVRIRVDGSALPGEVRRLTADAAKVAEDGFGASGKSAGAKFATMFKGGLIATTALAAGVFYEGIKQASEFQKNLVLIHTQAGAASENLGKIGESILKMAPQVGQGPVALAEALYHVESVGYRGATALNVLKIAAEGARLGNANLDSTTYALTSTLQTGIGGIHGAKDAMAALDAIVGTGDMRMQDLNAAIGTGFLASAETFGISLQSAGAALAYMTDRGSGGAESATRLRMTFALLAAPTTKAAGLLKDIGVSTTDAQARTVAMTQALQGAHLTTNQLAVDLRKPDGIFVALTDLKQHLSASGLSAEASAALISKAFGGGRMGATIESLYQHLDVLQNKYNAQIKTAGDFQSKWVETTQTVSFKFAALRAAIDADLIKIGQAALPLVSKVLGGLSTAFSGASLSNVGAFFKPLGVAIVDVGKALLPIARNLAPVGHLVELAFGGYAYAEVHAWAFLLRDVAAPALHVVNDAFGKLLPLTAATAAVVGAALVPALIRMLDTARVLGAVRFLELAGGLKSAAGAALAFVAANPEILLFAGGIAAAAAAFQHFSPAAHQAKVDTQAVTDAMKDFQKTGNDVNIDNTILGQLQKITVSNKHQDLLDYFGRLGVAGTTLVDALRDPAHAASSLTDNFTTLTGTTKTLAVMVATQAIPHFNSLTAAQKLVGESLLEVASKSGASQATLEKLGSFVSRYDRAVNGAGDSLKKQAQAQKVASDIAAQAADPLKVLSSAYDGVSKAQDAYDKLLAADQKTIYGATDAFKGLGKQAKVTAADILKNFQEVAKAYANEGANINKLAGEGLSAGLIAQAEKEGPQYVAALAAAAPKTLAGIKAVQAKISGEVNAAAVANARTGVDSAALAALQTLAAKKSAAEATAMQVYAGTVRTAFASATRIATAGSDDVANNVRARQDAARAGNLAAYLNSLDAPLRRTVASMLGVALAGGQATSQNVASGLANRTPSAAGAADRLRAAVQAKVDALHGKTINVDVVDHASTTLGTIKQAADAVARAMGFSNQAAKNMAATGQATGGEAGYPFAAGGATGAGVGGAHGGAHGAVHGPGTEKSDSIFARLSHNEHVTNAASAKQNRVLLNWMDRHPGVKLPKVLPGFAAGGPVDRWTETFDETAAAQKLIRLANDGGGNLNPVVAYARQYVGKVPYVWGGNTPAGWDCSGMTRWDYMHTGFGAGMPRVAGDQHRWSKPSGPVPGGLVFFGTPGAEHHVAMVSGPGRMISADHPGTVVQEEPIWSEPHSFGIPPGGRGGGIMAMAAALASGMSGIGGSDPTVAGAPTGATGGDAPYVGVAAAVLAELGLSSGLLPKVMRQMATEDPSGDLNAVNKWDKNWTVYGTPSVGLMQVIGPTFDAYANSYQGVGPKLYGVSTNPKANIYAGLNYGMHRYGSDLSGLGNGIGYAGGGPVLPAGLFDRGGRIPPGLSLALNKTGKSERVLDHASEANLDTRPVVEELRALRRDVARLTRAAEQAPGATGRAVGDSLNGVARGAALRQAANVR